MRAALAFALTGLFAGPALCETGDFVLPGVVLLEAGIYCPEVADGRMEAPDTESGYIDLLSGEVRAAYLGNVVPGEIGIGFGMRYQVEPETGMISGRMVVTHPPMGDSGITRQSYTVILDPAQSNMSQYDFDFPYEIVQGTWTMTLEIAGLPALRQSFTVVPPEAAPFSIDECEGPVPMS